MKNYRLTLTAPAVPDEREEGSPEQDHYHVHLGDLEANKSLHDEPVEGGIFVDFRDVPEGVAYPTSAVLRDAEGNNIGEVLVGPVVGGPVARTLNLPTAITVTEIP